MTLDPAIVRRIQRHVGVAEDGILGPATLREIDETLALAGQLASGILAPRVQTPGPTTGELPAATESVIRPGPTFGETLAELAEREVGVRENGRNSGPRIREYQSATWLTPGEWPWCAAFICWLIREAIRAHGPVRFVRPQTAGAWDFERWARQQSAVGVRLIKPKSGELAARGDIVIFTFSHIGLCTALERNGRVQTIEGNTNAEGSREGDGVWPKVRPVEKVRSLIRLAA